MIDSWLLIQWLPILIHSEAWKFDIKKKLKVVILVRDLVPKYCLKAIKSRYFTYKVT